MMNQLPDWMYHAIEESFTCQFASTTARDIPVSLPVFLNHFDPDTGTLIISSPVAMKRVENVRQRPKVAILFSPVGTGPGEPKHVLLVQGLAEVDDTILSLVGNGILRAGHDDNLRPAHRSREWSRPCQGTRNELSFVFDQLAFSAGLRAISSSSLSFWR